MAPPKPNANAPAATNTSVGRTNVSTTVPRQADATWAGSSLGQRLQAVDDVHDDDDQLGSPLSPLRHSTAASSLASSSARLVASSGTDATTPIVPRLQRDEMKMFGADPLHEELVLVRCKTCDKPLLPSSFAEHVERCRKLPPSTSSTSPVPPAGQPASRKRKSMAGTGMEDAPSASVAVALADQHPAHDPSSLDILSHLPRVELRRRKPGMVDFDVQCGVLTISGTPCTRPITCKLHSMYSKSTVVGRSRDFESLLRNYQRRVEQRFLGMSTFDDWDRATMQQQQQARHHPLDIDETVLDGDKDIDALIEALRNRRPPPLAVPQHACVKRRTTSLRMRDLLHAVLNDRLVKTTGNPLAAMQFSRVNMMAAAAAAQALSPQILSAASPLSNITQQPPLQPPMVETAAAAASGAKAKKPPKKQRPANASGQPKPTKKLSKKAAAAAAASALTSSSSSHPGAGGSLSGATAPTTAAANVADLNSLLVVSPVSGAGASIDPRDLF